MTVLTLHLLLPGDLSRSDARMLKRLSRSYGYDCIDFFTTDVGHAKPAEARDALWGVYDRARIANAVRHAQHAERSAAGTLGPIVAVRSTGEAGWAAAQASANKKSAKVLPEGVDPNAGTKRLFLSHVNDPISGS